MDPLKLGRCQVRVVGLHIHDKSILPTEDLPWAYPIEPVTSAAMNGIGHAPVGPVEGTSVMIMFRDPPYNQQPLILGTIGGIPQDENVVIGKMYDYDEVVNTPAGESSIPTNDTEVTSAEQPPPESVPAPTTDIPTTPPPSFTGNRAQAEAGIKAILAACDAVGLTSREQKCTALAIAGGESGWLPQSESYNYSAEALQRVFASTFGGKPSLAQQYARWKGSRESFFDFVYAPENNGRQLGNNQEGDGGKYYGRGFVQLTGRSNYARYSTLSGIDILNNPNSANDINNAAKLLVHYIKDRSPKSVAATDNPGYFYAAKKSVGNDVGDGAAKRLAYYEYFYGAQTPETANDVSKTASAIPPEQQPSPGGFVPSPSTTGGDYGFKDPNKKYPLQTLLKEPDTHRLARGIYEGTIVPIKDSKRDLGIPQALSESTIDQPSVPYGAKYPFNHTFETESGHIQEFDDTPGYERIHKYHRTGTFEEIDANGTKVVRIVGDSYQILDRNGVIHVMGSANVTVDGDINIFCQSNANIEVSGNAKMQVGGNYDIGVVGDMTVAVGGKLNMWSKGDASLQTTSNIDLLARGNVSSTADGTTNITSGNDINADGSNVYLNSGKSADAKEYTLEVPSARAALNRTTPLLETPPLQGESVYQFEDEDDWNTPEGQAAKVDMERKYGVQTPANTPSQDQAPATGGTQTSEVVSCAIVQGITSFTSSFRLSPNFTLGMMFDGGFNTKHILQDQNNCTKQDIVCNLSQLCNNILEKYLTVLPGGMSGYGKLWKINSGYRMGTSRSDHNTGRAVDIGLVNTGQDRKSATFELVKQLDKLIPYDQLILEYRNPNQVWIHTSYKGLNNGDTKGGGVNRKMAFTMLNDKTYGQGFILL